MKTTLLRAVGLACASTLVLCGCPPPIPPTPPLSSYDALNAKLAERASQVIVGTTTPQPSTQIVVTASDERIGALYRTGGRWIPYDNASCTFQVPEKRPIYSAFPPYTISKDLAVDLGLDNQLIQALSKFQITFDNNSSFAFSIAGPTLSVVPDDTLAKGLQDPTCQNAIAAAQGDLYVVRGYIAGTRQFKTTADTKRLIDAGINKIATFNINAGGGSSTIEIADSSPSDFLQVLEVVHRQSPPAAPPPPPASSTAPGGLPGTTGRSPASTDTGIIYVQQNRGDAISVGRSAVSLLLSEGLPVEPKVEQLTDTPRVSQVRYFTDSDQSTANQIASVLRAKFPNIGPVRFSIPTAKPGQLEVWLAKQP